MKKLFFIAVLLISGWNTANAQLSLRLNIGSQPAWGPVGYDHVDYYYIPDADMYYDVSRRVYVYRDGRSWRYARSVPSRYRNIDLYNVHKVVINGQRDPWRNHNRYYNQYTGYRGRRGQEVIRDSRDRRYWQNPGNSNYGQWRRENNPGRGRGRGNDRDRDRY